MLTNEPIDCNNGRTNNHFDCNDNCKHNCEETCEQASLNAMRVAMNYGMFDRDEDCNEL